MYSRIFLSITLLILTYGFWMSPELSEMSAGIAIFLFGILFLKNGFSIFSGGILEKILQRSTDKVYKSLLFGFFASTVMQSSTIVTVITITFLSVEFISLIQGIGIIFGSSLGTTTTAWLVAGVGLKVNLGAYAMPLLVFGMVFILQKSKNLNGIGYVLSGLGFIFLGFHFMKLGFESFNSIISFREYSMPGFLGILTFVLVGIIICTLLQSSTATITLLITAFSLGEITYENALGIVIGANIGTTLTGIIGSLASNINGKRLSIADFSFKTITGIIFIIFIYPIIDFVYLLGNYIGISQDDFTLRIALFHSLYSLIGIIILTPFIPKIAEILTKLIKDNSDKNYLHFEYLSDDNINLPDLAYKSLINESKRMYNIVIEVILSILSLDKSDIQIGYNFENIRKKIIIIDYEEIEKIYNKKIKILHGEIIDYSIKIKMNSSHNYNEKFNSIINNNRKLVGTLRILKDISINTKKYYNSTNLDLKNEYDMILKDIIDFLYNIEQLEKIISFDEKIKSMINIESKLLIDNKIDKLSINNLFKGKKISNTSGIELINDIYYKNKLLIDFIDVTKFININTISSDELNNNKKYKLSINKLINRKNYIKKVIKKLSNNTKIVDLKTELESIDLIILSYKIYFKG